jgi:hypothetical protein
MDCDLILVDFSVGELPDALILAYFSAQAFFLSDVGVTE